MTSDEFIAKRRELARLVDDIFDEFENDPTGCDVNTYLASKLLDAGYEKREGSEPVKRGRWEGGCQCSVCGDRHGPYNSRHRPYYNYCPNCGAKMDGSSNG